MKAICTKWYTFFCCWYNFFSCSIIRHVFCQFRLTNSCILDFQLTDNKHSNSHPTNVPCTINSKRHHVISLILPLRIYFMASVDSWRNSTKSPSSYSHSDRNCFVLSYTRLMALVYLLHLPSNFVMTKTISENGNALFLPRARTRT